MSGIIEKYHQHLPIDPKQIVTLQEGNTPLLPAPRLAQKIFGSVVIDLYLKLEGLNPTGSFKDRGMTYAVSKAVESGSKAVICASTGNTAASAAAYAARAGLKAFILLPAGKVAKGKLAQALIHRARVISIKGNFDQALSLVKELSKENGMTLVNSVNPYRLEGQKTAAFEIYEQLGRMPTHHALPVGNAGNITANWKGYKEWQGRVLSRVPPTRAIPSPRRDARGWTPDPSHPSLPVMLGFQAAGAAPIVTGKIVKNPKTIATAIRIGNPASWQGAITARDQSGGLIDSVTDKEILDAYQKIAALEGYFCEPASAASVAGIFKLAKKNYFKKGDIIVCTLTGHGLKDPETAVELVGTAKSVEPTVKAVRKAFS